MKTTFFAIAAIALATVVGAQTPVILSGPPQAIRLLPDQNLTQALDMVGCHPDWLSALVVENKIPPAQLGRLTFGHVYAMPAGVDCRTAPPESVAALSRSMMRTRTAAVRVDVLGSRMRALEADLAVAKAETTEAIAGMRRALDERRNCEAAVSGLEAERKTAQEERDGVRNALAARWPAWLTFVFGFIVAGALAGAAWFLRPRKVVVVER